MPGFLARLILKTRHSRVNARRPRVRPGEISGRSAPRVNS